MLDTKFRWHVYLTSFALVSQAIEAQPKVAPSKVSIPLRRQHCGAITPYVTTKTTVDLQVSLSLKYGVGSVEGTYVNDTMTLKSEDGSGQIEMKQAPIGKVSKLVGFDGFDGLMGLNIHPMNEPSYFINTPLTTFMWKRGLLKENMFAISGKPTRSMTPEKNGVITFGGIDKSRFIGQIYWYKCKTGSWWDWTATIKYGKTALSSGPIQGIFDTGFTLGPALSSKLFDKYVAAIPGAIFSYDDYNNNNPLGYVNRHLLKIPKTSISQMQDL